MTERPRFWKICFGSGGVTLVRTLCALVTNKLFAVFLSPALFACVGQFQNIFSIGQASSSLAMQNAVNALMAPKAHRSMHGNWTNPPTGSHVSPR